MTLQERRYQPAPDEIQAACETLLRAGLSRPARAVVRERYAASFRDCALGLLKTAREWKQMGRPDEVARLVKNARWHWRAYQQEKTHA